MVRLGDLRSQVVRDLPEESARMPGRYIVISGHGRSGTNWLLELLDYSRLTHCRNEPDMPGTQMSRLPGAWILDEDIEGRWDQVVDAVATSFAPPDALIPVRKDHIHGWSQRLGLLRIMQSRKARRFLGYLEPRFHREEWSVPWWVSSQSKMRQAVPVLKLVQTPGWTRWLLRNRPQARVLHIVRHPGGFLNSYANRWLASADHERTLRDNRNRLEQVAASDRSWGDRFGQISSMSLLESELWFWRYASEVIHEEGQASSNYQLLVYENLVRDPLSVSRGVYEGCGLPWDESIEQSIRKSSQASKSIAGAWREKLPREQIELVDSILEDSFMRPWWPNTVPGEPVRP